MCDPDVCDQDVCDPDVCDWDVSDPDVYDPDICDQDVCDPDVRDLDLCGQIFVSNIKQTFVTSNWMLKISIYALYIYQRNIQMFIMYLG